MADINDLRGQAKDWLKQMFVPKDVSMEGLVNTGVGKITTPLGMMAQPPGVTLGLAALTKLLQTKPGKEIAQMLDANGPLAGGLDDVLVAAAKAAPAMGVVAPLVTKLGMMKPRGLPAAPGEKFHSALAEAVDSKYLAPGAPSDLLSLNEVRAWIKKLPGMGIKKEEIKHFGMDEVLSEYQHPGDIPGKAPKISRQDLAEYVDGRMPEIQANELPGQYADQSLRGGTNQRALVINAPGTLKTKEVKAKYIDDLPENHPLRIEYRNKRNTVLDKRDIIQDKIDRLLGDTPYSGDIDNPYILKSPAQDLEYESLLESKFDLDAELNNISNEYTKRLQADPSLTYQKSFIKPSPLEDPTQESGRHFSNTDNNLLHVLAKDRMLSPAVGGPAKRTLFGEEVQSDWQQYAPDTYPMSSNYEDLAHKYLYRKAADEGYDAVGWVPGSVPIERYSGYKKAPRPVENINDFAYIPYSPDPNTLPNQHNADIARFEPFRPGITDVEKRAVLDEMNAVDDKYLKLAQEQGLQIPGSKERFDGNEVFYNQRMPLAARRHLKTMGADPTINDVVVKRDVNYADGPNDQVNDIRNRYAEEYPIEDGYSQPSPQPPMSYDIKPEHKATLLERPPDMTPEQFDWTKPLAGTTVPFWMLLGATGLNRLRRPATKPDE